MANVPMGALQQKHLTHVIRNTRPFLMRLHFFVSQVAKHFESELGEKYLGQRDWGVGLTDKVDLGGAMPQWLS